MDHLREKALKYIETHGSKHVWFCRQLGISQTHWRLWLNGDREFSEGVAEKLKEILNR